MTAGIDLKNHVPDSAEGVLANRDFRKLWAGESVSLTGTQITQLAFPLVAILSLHAGVFQVGLLNATRYAPVAVFSLLAGIWLDRRRRRPVLIGADLACATFIGLIPLCSVLGVLSMWVLCVAALLAGTAQVFFDIGALAYLPELVSRRHLASANSKMQISYSVAGIAGPSLGGLLIGVLTAPVTLTVNAVTYLFSAVMLLAIRKPEPDPRGTDRQTGEAAPSRRSMVAEGLRAVFGNRMLRPLLAQSSMFNFCFNALLTIFVVYAIRRVGLTSAELGVVIGAGAVAALIGALATTRITRVLGFGRMLLATVLGSCLAPLLLLAPGRASTVTLLILMLSMFVSGICAVLYNIGAVTLRQVVTPNRLLARMNGTYRMLLIGAAPLGALTGGALGSAVGLRPAMVIAVLAMLSPTVWIPFSPVFRLREMPAGPDESMTSSHDTH